MPIKRGKKKGQNQKEKEKDDCCQKALKESVSDHAPSRPCVFCSAVSSFFSLLSHCFALLTVPGVCVMDWATWWCVRHGLDYLVVCASWIGLPGGVFFVQICRRTQD